MHVWQARRAQKLSVDATGNRIVNKPWHGLWPSGQMHGQCMRQGLPDLTVMASTFHCSNIRASAAPPTCTACRHAARSRASTNPEHGPPPAGMHADHLLRWQHTAHPPDGRRPTMLGGRTSSTTARAINMASISVACGTSRLRSSTVAAKVIKPFCTCSGTMACSTPTSTSPPVLSFTTPRLDLNWGSTHYRERLRGKAFGMYSTDVVKIPMQQ